MMKSNLSTILSIPAVVLSLAACSRLSLDIPGSHQVRFSAKAGGIATKTTYGDIVEDGGKKYAIIKWNEGDKIRVYTAEGADIESGSSSSGFCYADYALSDIHQSGHASGAGKITAAGSGLNWKAESGSATFYAVYPATQDINTPSGGGLSAQVTIPLTQSGTADIAGLPLVASKTADYGETVDLTFNAAFSTFEFTIRSDTGSGTITLNSVTLSTKEEPGNTAYLAGTGDYNIGTGAFTYGASPSRAVTVTFPTPKKVITESEGATFTLFTLPVTMSQLTLTVNYTKDGNLVEKHLDLNQGGTSISFKAGCYTRIYGLALPDTGIRLFLGAVSVDNLIDAPHVINY